MFTNCRRVGFVFGGVCRILTCSCLLWRALLRHAPMRRHMRLCMRGGYSATHSLGSCILGASDMLFTAASFQK